MRWTPALLCGPIHRQMSRSPAVLFPSRGKNGKRKTGSNPPIYALWSKVGDGMVRRRRGFRFRRPECRR